MKSRIQNPEFRIQNKRKTEGKWRELLILTPEFWILNSAL